MVQEAQAVVSLRMFALDISTLVFTRLMEEAGKTTLLLARFMSRKLHVDRKMPN